MTFMKKCLYFILLFVNYFFLSAQSLEEVETFGLVGFHPQEGLFSSCLYPNEYKIVPFDSQNPLISGNDTFKIPHLSFSPAIYDTIGWDTIIVFPKYVYYHLRMGNEGNPDEIHFEENGKEYHVTAPKFEIITQKQNLVTPYLVWLNASKRERDPNCLSANPDDCFVLSLKQKRIEKRFTSQKLKTPAIMRIKEGLKDTTFQLFPPSPYLIEEKYAEQRAYIPKLRKIQTARIDTSWETFICEKEKIQDSTHKFVLARKGGLGEFNIHYCHRDYNYLPSIKMIQKALKNKGFYKGKITDRLDIETRAALVKFQKARNLPQGRLDADTIKELEIEVEDFQED
jgi:hypothetical protein